MSDEQPPVKETFGTPQGETCPRCGEHQMYAKEVWNSSSRVERGVYICGPCGNDEAMRDITRTTQIERSDWYDHSNG